MDITSIIKLLTQRGAIYGKHYTIGGLGYNIFGIEKMGRFWYSYETKKNRKTNYSRFSSEKDAYKFIIEKAKSTAESYGL